MNRTLFDINHSKIFCEPPPRIMERKTKIHKCDLIKLKSLCTAKETINKTEWEKIFTNETTDKGLISKIYKQVMQLNIKKQTIQSKNGWKIYIDISPKKIYRWPTNTWKNTQHH